MGKNKNKSKTEAPAQGDASDFDGPEESSTTSVEELDVEAANKEAESLGEAEEQEVPEEPVEKKEKRHVGHHPVTKEPVYI